jgi:hypothetical protein
LLQLALSEGESYRYESTYSTVIIDMIDILVQDRGHDEVRWNKETFHEKKEYIFNVDILQHNLQPFYCSNQVPNSIVGKRDVLLLNSTRLLHSPSP